MKTQLEKIVYKKIFAKSILARDEKGALELLKKVINQDKTDLLKVSFLKKVIYKLADRGETTRIEKYEPLPDNLLPFKEVKKKKKLMK